ncbi:60S ribosomal protein L17 [Panus rudis PR-1116 ss-1]|nr:60S ribosomal protein L17 [Panus rudis PR-1116 ss-1]
MFSRAALSSCRAQRNLKHYPRARSLATVSADPGSTTSTIPQKDVSGQVKPTLQTAIILNRSPIITREPYPFERAYYAYQARIQRALHNPFPYDFYFKAGSLLEGRFREEEAQREKEAFGRPVRRRKGSADPSASAQPTEIVDGEEKLRPAPRVHPSDKTGDVKSLDRAGERNLYLLVFGKDQAGNQVWRFPQGGLQAGELLHEAAHRDLQAECGNAMDTWIVSRKPIGVHQPSPNEELYLFFYKAHIMSGQVRPDSKNVTDFAWLTKEEIKPRVSKDYWLGIKDMLSDF